MDRPRPVKEERLYGIEGRVEKRRLNGREEGAGGEEDGMRVGIEGTIGGNWRTV